MKIKKIETLGLPRDLVNDCLDVFVTLEDDYGTEEFSYCIEVITPQFLSVLMDDNNGNFLPPQDPYIIVSKLTNDIIKAAIQSFIDEDDDLYWLKLYHLTASLTIEEINEILERKEKEQISLDSKINLKTERKLGHLLYLTLLYILVFIIYLTQNGAIYLDRFIKKIKESLVV